jgi:uncharacterized membrane protein
MVLFALGRSRRILQVVAGVLLTLVPLLLGAVVFLGIWLWRRFGASQAVASWTQPQATRQPAAREILQARYARGELTREEYQRMVEDLA